jgi:hypothetical protein
MELGLVNNLGRQEPFTVPKRNTFIVGQPRTGKSETLIRLALDEIYNKKPIVFISSRGKAIAEILNHIPKKRQNDVLLFQPSRFPFAFNILARVPQERHALLATTILDTVKGIWGYDRTPTPNIDQYIRAGIGTLLSVKGTTLLSLKFLLTDNSYRTELLGYVSDVLLKDFWDDFEELTDKEKRQETASTLNKVRAFMFEPLVRNCIDQRTNKLVLKDKIVLVSLDEARLGDENASLLGALVLAHLFVEAVYELDTTLFIDDAYRFGTAILGKLLTTDVPTVLTAQYLDQFSRDFQPQLLGSIEHIMATRTSLKDSETLAAYFDLDNHTGELHEQHPYRALVSVEGRTTAITLAMHEYES